MSSMSKLNEKIENEKKKLEQLEHQKKMQVKREQERKRKTDTRRYIIIGEMFTKHFPDVLLLMPRSTTAENNIEFAPLDEFLSTLVAEKDLKLLLNRSRS